VRVAPPPPPLSIVLTNASCGSRKWRENSNLRAFQREAQENDDSQHMRASNYIVGLRLSTRASLLAHWAADDNDDDDEAQKPNVLFAPDPCVASPRSAALRGALSLKIDKGRFYSPIAAATVRAEWERASARGARAGCILQQLPARHVTAINMGPRCILERTRGALWGPACQPILCQKQREVCVCMCLLLFC
jgi:hypothetical protein